MQRNIKQENKMSILETKQLSFKYNIGNKYVLEKINFSIEQGEIVTICGGSGCGKTTFLKHFKSAISPYGEIQGEIFYKGHPLQDISLEEQTKHIGYVSQIADNQIVTDKVYHELAFGLESLAYDNQTIRLRVAEMASFFGLERLFYRNVSELSGGQKQLLTLAAVMTMKPEILILDEPTSQLDPIAAGDFIQMVLKINRDFGTTILITEHRLDEIIPYSNRVVVMEEGKILADDTPQQVCRMLHKWNHPMLESMPVPVRIWSELAKKTDTDSIPITINQARVWFETVFEQQYGDSRMRISESDKLNTETVLQAKELYFKYEKKGPDILSGVSLNIQRGEIFGILGGNGAGKSTLLSVISGVCKPYYGKVKCKNIKIALLPQEPATLFVKKTIYEDLLEMGNPSDSDFLEEVQKVLKICKLESLKESNIYDISGGEKQRAGMAKVLLTNPDILLLDEPTKGMDNFYKTQYGTILQELVSQGKTVLMVSHDIEFCAEYTNRCAMMFQGNIIAWNDTRKFFENNSFYTTATNRIAGDYIENAIIISDLTKIFDEKIDKTFIKKSESHARQQTSVSEKRQRIDKMADTKANSHNQSFDSYRISKKEILISIITICFLIPLTIFVGVHYLQDQKYLFISLLIMVECIGMFIAVFESRGADAREIVLVSVISALAVAGRLAFYMYPEFKPVMAIVIITAVAIGPVNGFLVGAVTMLASNMIFGQGPWTPWQMFAMGLIGFFAGFLFQGMKKNGFYNRIAGRIAIGIFGIISAVVIYGGIMNPAAAVMAHMELNRAVLMSYYLSGFPLDLTQGITTFIFIVLLSGVMIDKIMRVKNKYGV